MLAPEAVRGLLSLREAMHHTRANLLPFTISEHFSCQVSRRSPQREVIGRGADERRLIAGEIGTLSGIGGEFDNLFFVSLPPALAPLIPEILLEHAITVEPHVSIAIA